MEELYTKIIRLLQCEFCNHTFSYSYSEHMRGEFRMRITTRNFDGINQINILVVSQKNSDILYDTTIRDNGFINEHRSKNAPIKWISNMFSEVETRCWLASL